MIQQLHTLNHQALWFLLKLMKIKMRIQAQVKVQGDDLDQDKDLVVQVLKDRRETPLEVNLLKELIRLQILL
jgi:hypothetical protein